MAAQGFSVSINDIHSKISRISGNVLFIGKQLFWGRYKHAWFVRGSALSVRSFCMPGCGWSHCPTPLPPST